MTFTADQSFSKISCKLRPGLSEGNHFASFRRFICLTQVYQNTFGKPKSLPRPTKASKFWPRKCSRRTVLENFLNENQIILPPVHDKSRLVYRRYTFSRLTLVICITIKLACMRGNLISGYFGSFGPKLPRIHVRLHLSNRKRFPCLHSLI